MIFLVALTILVLAATSTGGPLNSHCTTDDDCSSFDSFCKTNVCTCKESFQQFYDTCLRISTPTFQCDSDEDCKASMGDGSTCKKSHCRCQLNHHLHINNTCIKSKVLTESCNFDEECYCGENCLENIACLSGVCACKKGFVSINKRCKQKGHHTMKNIGDRAEELNLPTENIAVTIHPEIMKILTMNSSQMSDKSGSESFLEHFKADLTKSGKHRTATLTSKENSADSVNTNVEHHKKSATHVDEKYESPINNTTEEEKSNSKAEIKANLKNGKNNISRESTPFHDVVVSSKTTIEKLENGLKSNGAWKKKSYLQNITHLEKNSQLQQHVYLENNARLGQNANLKKNFAEGIDDKDDSVSMENQTHLHKHILEVQTENSCESGECIGHQKTETHKSKSVFRNIQISLNKCGTTYTCNWDDTLKKSEIPSLADFHKDDNGREVIANSTVGKNSNNTQCALQVSGSDYSYISHYIKAYFVAYLLV